MMDKYTNDTKNWLDNRFRETDDAGIYFAHQPIYGFRKGPSEPGIIVRYTITYQIMKALSHLTFTSLLDVGGAEGYKAALARSIFNVSVQSVDLSAEACKRAKEIFDVDGEPIDIHNLPYNDNEFDVVLCSETLEHVSDIQSATRELIRVCKKAVVITVPHEPKEVIKNNIKNNIPHAHIHSLDTNSFDFVIPTISKIISRRFHNPAFMKISALADAMKREQIKNYPRLIVNMYNCLVPLFRLVFCNRSIGMLIKFDDYISNVFPSYSAMVFILLKDTSCYSASPMKHISIPQIIDFKVPYHYIQMVTVPEITKE
jgi:ubiquinone/menaquinone biosynthesis C-methylase UbiE